MQKPEFQKQFGKRIGLLRKSKGLSQEALAYRIGISRPSLVQLEAGNRSIDLFELQQLQKELAFSVDEFLLADYKLQEAEPVYATKSKKKSTIRNATPHLQIEKMKQILLYMLEKVGSKPNVNETVLHKLLYFADFNYYQLYEEQLTGATYKKLPFGPTPGKIDWVIKHMIQEQQVQQMVVQYHGVNHTRFIPLVKADLSMLKASEKETIDQVMNQMSDWSGKVITDYAQQDVPWLASKSGEEINYEFAFYRTAPYSVRHDEQ